MLHHLQRLWWVSKLIKQKKSKTIGITQHIKVKGKEDIIISKIHEGKESKNINNCNICKNLKKTNDKEIVKQLFIFIKELHENIKEQRSQDIIDHLIEIIEGEYT